MKRLLGCTGATLNLEIIQNRGISSQLAVEVLWFVVRVLPGKSLDLASNASVLSSCSGLQPTATELACNCLWDACNVSFNAVHVLTYDGCPKVELGVLATLGTAQGLRVLHHIP